MKGDTPLIEYADKPERLRLVPVPKEGLVLLYGDGHEEYVRSCEMCGHRMGVSTRWGGMPQWFCPVASDGGACSNVQRIPVAKMSSALAANLAELLPVENCHACGEGVMVVGLLRRLSRVEVILRHPKDHPCKAETIYIFQTYNSAEFMKQEWNEPKPRTVEENLKTLETWSREEAAQRVKESREK